MTTRAKPGEIFYNLLEVEESRRAAALEEACAGDEQLRAEVRSLLDAHGAAGGFFLTEHLRGVALAQEMAPLDPGVRVAGYTIRSLLGVGGMGMVYIAEQDRPRRTVALKLIRRGAGGLLRRFEHEAEVLGRMHHPGIAQIFEAGTTELGGRGATPFIAMELVKGTTLTEHARGLPVRERLRLVARVCEAVHHAHQRGIIHRDLKPGNILVDGLGQPKVLDFGVARGVGANVSLASAGTGAGQIVGTLQYMSPEQVRADPGEVDIRCDVYALGVVLFEVLTGKLPHDVAEMSFPEAARVICESTPARTGELDRTLTGDVEVIVAKALEKDKARRYASAEALGQDLTRYLDGRPISARDDSALYVIRKQMRRYAGAVTAAGASILALAAFAVYASVQSSRNSELARNAGNATVRALDALADARAARTQADQNAERLRAELAVSTVERGRLLGKTGNLAGAESLLWPAHLQNPTRHTRWALWELYAHEPSLATMPLHTSEVRGIGVSAPLGALFSVATEGVLKGWDLAAARPLDGLENPAGPVVSLAMSADGRSMVTGHADGKVLVWDAATRRVRLTIAGHRHAVHAVAFSPDGLRVVSGGEDHDVLVWDAVSGSAHGAMPGTVPQTAGRMAWSPDGKWVAVSFGFTDMRAALWDTVGEPRYLVGHTGGVLPVAFSPDSRMVATGSNDREIRLWDVATRETVARLTANNGTIRNLHFGGDGRTLISSGWWTIDQWDLSTRERTRSMALRNGAEVLTYSAEAGLVASGGGDGLVQVWDLTPSQGIVRMGGHQGRVASALRSDGRVLATGDAAGRLRLWDCLAGRCLVSMQAHAARIHSVKFSPDGYTLATGGEDGELRLWDLRSGTMLAGIGGHASVTGDSFSFNESGRWLAAARTDWTVSIFRSPSFDEERRLDAAGAEVVGVRFDRAGRSLVSFSRDRIIRYWPTMDSEPVQLKHDYHVSSWVGSFSPDGKRLAVGDWGKEVQLWDLPARKLTGWLRGHTSLVTGIQFIPGEGTIVASSSSDGTVRIWDADSGLCLVTLDAFPGFEALSVTLSDDGRYLASSSSNGEAVVWDLTAFDRHIAGNAEYQIAKLSPEAASAAKLEVMRRWARQVWDRPVAPGPVTGVDPGVIEAWGAARK